MEIARKAKWWYMVTEKMRVNASSVIRRAADRAAIPGTTMTMQSSGTSFALGRERIEALSCSRRKAKTGARVLCRSSVADLRCRVYNTIAEELASQDALGYTSKNPKRDGAFRRVVVRVENLPGARTRTRSGYQAARVERVVATIQE